MKVIMSLTSCEECGKDVSTKAKTCPHCGVSRSSPSISGLTFVVGGIVFVTMMALIISMDNRSSSPTRVAPDTTSAQIVCNALRTTDIELNCSFDSSQRRITLIVNTNYMEAKEMCSGIRQEIAPYTSQLAGWHLGIYSPLDLNSPLTSCTL